MRFNVYAFLTAFFLVSGLNKINAQVCSPTPTQTFSNTTPVVIPIAGANTVTSTITVAGAPVFLLDLNVTTALVHSFNSDLDITITSPAGTVVSLTTDNGGSNDNIFNGTVWDDDANPGGSVPSTSNNGLVTGAIFTNNVLASPLVPEEPLGAFIGENPNGVWTITIADQFNLDGGSLNSWSLDIRGLTAAPTTAMTSVTNNVPVVIPIAGANTVTSTILIAGAGTQILKTTLTTFLTHSFNSDLDITITSPAGTIVTLATDNGGSNDNIYNGTVWDDDANPGGTVPYTTNNGVASDHAYANNVLASPLTPEEALAAFVGEDPNGTWTLTIADQFNLDGGTLSSWTLNLQTSLCPAPSCIVTCPVNMSAPADPGLCTAVVNYPAPTSSGSCGPIVTFPASGSAFPSGVNTVNAYNLGNSKIYGLTIGGELVSFNYGTPSVLSAPIVITGMAAGEFMAGIDFRPANGLMYGIAVGGAGTYGKLYSINTATGAATQVGSSTFAVNGVQYGMDFNPTVDRIRFVTDAGMNMRINPNDGTLTALDAALNPGTPNVSGSAYINNFNGATTTTLYDIDFTTDQLYVQVPPNNGTLVPVGPLGIDAVSQVGFDIRATNNAVAALSLDGVTSGIYNIDLTTGAATLIGTTPGNLFIGLAFAPLSTQVPSCSFTITVSDTQVPVITCPGNLSANNTTGLCSATVATPNPTTADNCAVTRLTWALTGATVATSPATGINPIGSRSFNVGVTTVTYTVADAAGNTATCNFTVTVTDTQAPTLTCPANITVSNGAGLCSASVAVPNLTNSDNCAVTVRTWTMSGATTGASPLTGLNNVGTQTFNVGVTTIQYNIRDAAGNTNTCSFTVTVNDTQAPSIVCPTVPPATTPVGSCTAVVNYTVTATDNCPGVTWVRTAGLASGSAFPIGTNVVTWTATDAAGNTSSCSFNVVVIDGQLPVITTHPANRTACAGTNAVFSVISTNTTTYQWQTWNGTAWVNIAGATGSTHTVNNVTTAMNTNTFRVVIGGLCTSNIISNPATLFVNTNPVITLSSSKPPFLQPGQTLDITATGIPPGGSFVWLFNGVAIPGATTNTLTNLGVDDFGSYSVRYTDANGCITTSAVLVLTGMSSENLWVYPNPNLGTFQVRFFNSNPENATVRVYNSNGMRVYQKTVTTTLPYTMIDIDLGPTAASGTYVVELVNQAGKRVGAKQIIVRHN